MSVGFVVLAEVQDDLEAHVIQSLLFDADIDIELEEEKARGMTVRPEDSLIRVLVRPDELDRARCLLGRRRELLRLPPAGATRD